MEGLMISILILIFIVCIISVFYAITYNRFQDYIIRINEVESIIDNKLRAKYDLLNRSIPIIKSNIDNDKKDIFEEVVKIRSRKVSNFELYRILIRTSDELYAIKEKFPVIEESEEIKKIIKQINKIDNDLVGILEYYNDNITIYNTMLRKFPSNVVSIICKYKEKLFFDRKDMNDEDFEDFKL